MSERLRRPFYLLLRLRYALLTAWLVIAAARKPFGAIDWGWFIDGTDLLFRGDYANADGPGGLHAYATEPALHMGPLSLLAAGAFRFLYPGDTKIGAAVLLSALGPLVVLVAERAAVRARGLRSALDEPRLAVVTLVSGAAFLYGWADVAWLWGRIDEVMAICGAVAALWFVVNANPLLAGAAIGVALGSKSWALFLLPLLAGLPRRDALRAAALALAMGTAVWLPFVLADSGTIDAIRADTALRVRPDSGLHALGVDVGLTPDWVRPVQIAVALALAGFAVIRGRWGAAVLLAIAARLALDPATISYYAAALVFAALIWDLLVSRVPLPIWGISIFVAFYGVPRLLDDPEAQGLARIAIALAAAVVLVGAPKPWLRQPRPSPA